MKLSITTNAGVHSVEINNCDSVSDLREKLLRDKIVRSPTFKITLNGKILADSSHLRDFPNIESQRITIYVDDLQQQNYMCSQNAISSLPSINPNSVFSNPTGSSSINAILSSPQKNDSLGFIPSSNYKMNNHLSSNTNASNGVTNINNINSILNGPPSLLNNAPNRNLYGSNSISDILNEPIANLDNDKIDFHIDQSTAQKVKTIEEEEEEEETYEDPPNFLQLVNELCDMGFEKKQAMAALRYSDYRTDLAANMLLNGNVTKSGKLANNDSDDDEDEYESDEDGHVMSRKNLGQSRDVYDTFSLSEKSTVHRLSKKYGVEIAETVQIFLIAEKNEENAVNLLEQFGSKKRK
ncbi:hypothetical protein TRFO_43243 [Tritrichomonas foetus]|uniref:UBA domain-containing protein n=1 Tax=Tritrichomonas foetus TaxID=1144522 RepID=A0A1J4KVW1_9EUKA|nr:hypothetical protein TRFO_43243 [Tritrichomonas foetus]|eukprot:OHT13838.1 hypothetical protein TRFO_43243 [Tritrichomonas foetus]